MARIPSADPSRTDTLSGIGTLFGDIATIGSYVFGRNQNGANFWGQLDKFDWLTSPHVERLLTPDGKTIYLYRPDGWIPNPKRVALVGTANFGYKMAFDGDAILVTDPLEGDGASYIYSLAQPQPPTAGITLTETAGTDASTCGATNTLTVTAGSTVYYCYAIQNTGNITLADHSLTDDHLGQHVFAAEVAPNATLNTVNEGFIFSATVDVTTTNTVTWTARTNSYAAAQATAQATVYVTQPAVAPQDGNILPSNTKEKGRTVDMQLFLPVLIR